MPLSDVAGQRRAYEILAGGLRRDQVHHAYLFGGPEGSGTEEAALLLAQALNCDEKPNEGCGRCGSCKRIASHNHPDITWVMPEAEMVARKQALRSDFAETPSRDVKIAQIRALLGRMSVKALSARRKIAIILCADRMNVSAQNALLKTLEEPPPATSLILATAVPDALLPTIRSRCLRVTFVPPPLEEVAQRVAHDRKLPLERAMLCARLAQGALPRALQLDEERLARRLALYEGVQRLQADDARPAIDLAEEFASDRAEAEWTLGMLELWLRDQLVLLAGDRDKVLNADVVPLLSQAAAGQPASRVLERLAGIKEAEENLTRNAGPRFQLERIFLRYLP